MKPFLWQWKSIKTNYDKWKQQKILFGFALRRLFLQDISVRKWETKKVSNLILLIKTLKT